MSQPMALMSIRPELQQHPLLLATLRSSLLPLSRREPSLGRPSLPEVKEEDMPEAWNHVQIKLDRFIRVSVAK